MAYQVTKDLQADVKVSGSLFLKDLFFLISYPTAVWFVTDGVVADGLKIPFVIFNIVVALALLHRPASNPGKQAWQVLLLILAQDTAPYHMQQIPEWAKEEEDDAFYGS